MKRGKVGCPEAKQTSTPVVIWEDEQIREVPPEEAEIRINVKPSLEAGA